MFLDNDRDIALAMMAEDADRCPGCGQPRSESMRLENFERYDSEPVFCHACIEREAADERHRKREGNETRGLYWRVFLPATNGHRH